MTGRVVTIDLDDTTQVESLAREIWLYADVRTRIEKFAEVVAHRLERFLPIEEPTGLGAVVEDAEGDLWVRREAQAPWINSAGKTFPVSWASINVVRVLSEGVTL